MKRALIVIGALSVGAALASPASTAVYSFELSGSQQASFQLESTLPTSSTPANPAFDFGQVTFNNVSGTFGGASGTGSISFGEGYVASFQISGTSLGFTQFGGPALYSGPTSSPMFNIGSFTLTNPFFGLNDVLTVSQVAAVPEPSTWAMMLLGFAGIATMTYRRRKVVALVA